MVAGSVRALGAAIEALADAAEAEVPRAVKLVASTTIVSNNSDGRWTRGFIGGYMLLPR